MEYINTLIATNSVQTKPTDIPNKQDLIREGVNFTDTKPIFEINLPNGGAIVRDIHLNSSNVIEITVTFTTESGHETVPIKGAPESLPTSEFPTEKVTEIVVKVTKTTAETAPEDVTLSVIACAEGSTTTTTTGNAFITCFFFKRRRYLSYARNITFFKFLGTTQTTGSSPQVSSQSPTAGLSSVKGTSVSSEGIPQTSPQTVLSTLGSSSSNAPGTSPSSQGSPSSSASPTATAPGTTTAKACEQMEYINTLIATNSVQTKPTDIPNKQDLIRKGVDFTDTKPVFEINLPNGGATVRDIHLYSSNVIEITVTFTTESGRETVPIKGAPESLPTSEFPTEKVTEIVVKVTKTRADTAPEDVTLSVIACAEGSTTTASTGNAFITFCFFNKRTCL
jgi:hypothetical protein